VLPGTPYSDFLHSHKRTIYHDWEQLPKGMGREPGPNYQI
jgi:hypothetical protein